MEMYLKMNSICHFCNNSTTIKFYCLKYTISIYFIKIFTTIGLEISLIMQFDNFIRFAFYANIKYRDRILYVTPNHCYLFNLLENIEDANITLRKVRK